MAFGGCPLLFHKGNASQAEFEKYREFLFRQIALKTFAFMAIRVHYQNGRGPDRFEPAKVFRIFLDVDVKRDELFVDDGRQTGVAVRLIFESLARASGRRCAEINKQWFILFFRFSQCIVGISDPVDGHYIPPRLKFFYTLILSDSQKCYWQIHFADSASFSIKLSGIAI